MGAAPLVYLQIPFAMGLGWSLGQHTPTLRALVGMAAIGIVAFYVWQREPRRVGRLVHNTTAKGLE